MKLPENVNWHLANAYVVMKMPKSLINIIGVWQRVRAGGVVIFYRAAKSIIPSMFTFRSENNCFRSYSLKCCHRKARNIWPSVSVSVFTPLSLNITYQYQTSENSKFYNWFLESNRKKKPLSRVNKQRTEELMRRRTVTDGKSARNRMLCSLSMIGKMMDKTHLPEVHNSTMAI